MYSVTVQRERFFGHFFLAIAIVIPLSLLTIRTLVPETAVLMRDRILHTFLESLSSFLAIAMGVLLYVMQKRLNWGAKFLWMSCSMLSMGILMALQAVSPHDENTMRAMELTYNIVGGFLACFCLLPRTFMAEQSRRTLALWVSVVTSLLIGVTIHRFNESLPQLVVNDHFTPLNTYIGLFAGTAFLVAAGRCFVDYRKSRKVKDLYLIDFLLLSGLSTVIPSGAFFIWGPLWWGWHFIQLLSFVSVSFLFLYLGIQFEKQLAQSEERFRLLTIELERSNQDLKNFAAFASHDLKEPVRTIQAHLTLLQRRCKDKLDADSLDFVNFAVDAASRMRRMIDGFLYYSRLDAAPQFAKTVSLSQTLKQVLANLNLLISETGAVVRSSDLPDVNGDTAQLSELLQNLITNAIKFRDPSRVPEIVISAERQGDSWMITFSDNGIGIPKDQLGSVFELLKRLHGNEVEGSGLGLAICKRIVERHGGTISADSELGKGTTLKIRLPVVRTPVVEEPTVTLAPLAANLGY